MSVITCATCDRTECKSPTIRARRPQTSCSAWTNKRIREQIKTIPVFSADDLQGFYAEVTGQQRFKF